MMNPSPAYGRVPAGLVTLSFIIAIFFVSAAYSQDDFKPKIRPTLNVSKLVGGPIKIDGVFDEPAWQNAARADGFAENEPGDQVKPPVQSYVLITYDENNLYLGFVAFDDPSTIRYSLRDRDNIFSDDYFGAMIDTYGDASWAYELFVNPLGIQGDLRMLSNGNEDMSFDVVWESRGMVTDSGYQAEVAVPFSSLRFPNKPEQVWRVNFWRDRQREVRRKFSWAAISRDEPCFMCQCGTITGISGIKPGSHLEVLPNIVASQAGELRDAAHPSAGFSNGDPEAQLSVNTRYGLSSNTSAEATINPDFSQVESDATQIDVNSPTALFFEERRPFFQEGSDLFSTWMTPIYTRSIADPQVAGKLSGRLGHNSFAYLLARDEHSPVLVPAAERSYLWRAGKSTTNVARFRHPFRDDSYFGAVFTDRRLEGGGSGTIFGGDASYRFSRNYRFDIQVLGSHSDEPVDSALTASAGSTRFDRGKHSIAFDGESFWGHGFFVGMVHDTRFWTATISTSSLSPTFRADNGFETRNDFRQVELYNQLTFRSSSKLLQRVDPNVTVGRKWDYTGLRKDEWLTPQIQATFIGQTTVTVEYLLSRELYHDIWFSDIHRAEVIVNTRPTGFFGLNVNFTVGTTIARNIPTPVLGDSRDLFVSVSLKPTKQLLVEPQISYSTMDYPNGGPNIYDVYVARTRVTYQFTRQLFLRLVTEYVHSKDITDTPSEYDKQATLTFEPLLSYKLNPFTVFYIGSAHDYWDVNQEGHLYRSSQRFFAKFQYLFRI